MFTLTPALILSSLAILSNAAPQLLPPLPLPVPLPLPSLPVPGLPAVPSLPVPVPSLPVPVPSLPVPVPSLPVPVPSLPVPVPSLPIPDPSLPVPSLPVPVPSLPVPVPSLPVPVPSLPVPVPSLPVPVPSLPVPIPSLPVPLPRRFLKTSLAPSRALAALPPTISASSCDTGNLQCCQSIQDSAPSANSTIGGVLSLLGISAQGLDVPVGVTCSGVSVFGASATSCTAQPVCCRNNDYNGIVALGCTPIDLTA